MSARLATVVAIAASLVACGGGNANSGGAATPKAAGPEVATGDTLTSFQRTRLLGHYSTQDGASGFILDRTVTPWRAKLDATPDVVTLEKTNTPRHGQTEYASADHRIWIRVDDASGEVLLFQGPKQHEGVEVQRDAEAKELR